MSWSYNFVNPLDELSRAAPYVVDYALLRKRAFDYFFLNPFTPTGRASIAITAAKLGGAYALERGYRYMTRPAKRQRTGGYPIPQKQYTSAQMTSVVAATGVIQRRQRSERLRSGRLGRKLDAETADYVFRFSRVYQFGQNTDAYPTNVTQATADINNCRLQLTHVQSGAAGSNNQVNVMPYYMLDLTSSRWSPSLSTATGPTAGVDASNVLKRLVFDATGSPGWQTVYTQSDNGASAAENFWQIEETQKNGTGTFGYPNYPEKKSVLSWADIRLAVYGAREHTTKVFVEFVQFKDANYALGYHNYATGSPPTTITGSDPAYSSLTKAEQNDVLTFWQNEVRRSLYHPIDAYQANRAKGLRVIYSKKIVLNPDESTNLDVSPPVQLVKIFKKFNRLCRWQWQKAAPLIEANKGELDTAGWNTRTGTQFVPFLDPKARIYMVIRAEDFTPVPYDTALSTAGTNGNVTRTIVTTYPTEYTYPTLPPTYKDASDVQAAATSTTWAGIQTAVNSYVPAYNLTVSGQEWQYGVIAGNHYGLLMPRFESNVKQEVITETTSATAATWCTAGCPTFDLIVRVKHRIQE